MRKRRGYPKRGRSNRSYKKRGRSTRRIRKTFKRDPIGNRL